VGGMCIAVRVRSGRPVLLARSLCLAASEQSPAASGLPCCAAAAKAQHAGPQAAEV